MTKQKTVIEHKQVEGGKKKKKINGLIVHWVNMWVSTRTGRGGGQRLKTEEGSSKQKNSTKEGWWTVDGGGWEETYSLTTTEEEEIIHTDMTKQLAHGIDSSENCFLIYFLWTIDMQHTLQIVMWTLIAKVKNRLIQLEISFRQTCDNKCHWQNRRKKIFVLTTDLIW